MAAPREHPLAFSGMKAGCESPSLQHSALQHHSKQSFIHTRCSKNACLSGHYQSRRKNQILLKDVYSSTVFSVQDSSERNQPQCWRGPRDHHRLAGGRKRGRTTEHIGGLPPRQDLQSAIPDIPTLRSRPLASAPTIWLSALRDWKRRKQPEITRFGVLK